MPAAPYRRLAGKKVVPVAMRPEVPGQGGNVESHFDLLAKALAGSTSRREALRRVGGIVAATLLASLGVGCENESTGPRFLRPLFDARGRCKKVGQTCRQNSECCSNLCDPFTGHCACAPRTVVCPASRQCVPGCISPFQFNPDTCQCECPSNTVCE